MNKIQTKILAPCRICGRLCKTGLDFEDLYRTFVLCNECSNSIKGLKAYEKSDFQYIWFADNGEVCENPDDIGKIGWNISDKIF